MRGGVALAPAQPRRVRVTTDHEFRPDIEGMRAVAVGLVLAYHAGIPFVPGGFIGVDVFFVISGYLITGMLVREIEQTGRLSLVNFYARRAKRLLPAAALVLATTALLTLLFVSVIDWRTFGIDIAAAAVYVVNWRLADRSVDYLAEDIDASPVQHFWSLAVEEQFYIVWPLLLLLVAWWVRRSGWSVRRTMALALTLVAVPSLMWSTHLTSSSPSEAFFVTTTRMWELAAGAFVAIAASRFARTPRLLAVAGSWAGLCAVLVSSVVVDTATPWPGTAALAPVLGTATVIAFGRAAATGGPVVILRYGLLQWIGKLSYSLYLWHWPLLIAATAYWGGLSVELGIAVTALAFLPAWLAYRLVEEPIRRLPILARRPRIALAAGGILSAAGVAAGGLLVLSVTLTAGDESGRAAPGAAVLGRPPADGADTTIVSSVDWMTPAPVNAPDDLPVGYADGCQADVNATTPTVCEYGHSDSDFTVALVGDSKILQWQSAFIEIAEKRGRRLLTITKSACSFADAVITTSGEVYETCIKWNDAVVRQLLDVKPDLVVTSQGQDEALNTANDGDGGVSRDAMASGLARRWQRLEEHQIDVAVLYDNASSGTHIYECVQENRTDLTRCAFNRDEGIERSAAPTQRMAVSMSDGVETIDLGDAVCPGETCAPVIGNVLVYRQGSHITDTYVRTLTPQLERALDELEAGPSPTRLD